MSISALWTACCRRGMCGLLGLSLLFVLLSTFSPNANAQDGLRAFRFVENIGQWERPALFQGMIGSALVRFSPATVSYWYPVNSRGADSQTNTHGYLLQTAFLNAHFDAQVSGEEMAGGLHNYYLGNGPNRQFVGANDFRRIRYHNLYDNIDAIFSQVQQTDDGEEEIGTTSEGKAKGQDGRLKYDFVVRPGGNPADVVVRYQGAKELRINAKGELEVVTEFGVVREARPYSYQEIGGHRIEVPADYRLIGHDTYGFRLGNYDPNRTLVIDPCLSIEYLTYLGAGGFDEITAMATDSTGNGYAVGITRAATFPTVPPVGELPPRNHIFVSKITPDGSALIYSTIFGPEYEGQYGTTPSGAINLFEAVGEDVEITPDGKAVVGMTTNLVGLTTTTGAYQADRAQNRINGICGPPFADNFDLYLFQLSNTGSIEWGTYLGGSDDDYLRDIALDASGNIALTGITHTPRCGSNEDSLDFPVTIPTDSFSTTAKFRGFETFVSELDPSGRNLRFSALYGGGGNEFVGRIGIGPSGDIYLLGSTNSSDLKTTAGAFQEKPNPGLSTGVYDIYLARINPGTAELIYSTYVSDNGAAGRRGLGYGRYTDRWRFGQPIGGFEQEGRYQGLLMEAEGVVLFGGSTRSTTLPTTPGVFQGSPNNPGGDDSTGLDAFLVRFDMNANRIVTATYLGGSGFDALGGIAFDNEGNIAVGVSTSSTNYPITRFNVQDKLRGNADAALTVLNPGLNGMEYSSFVGGGPLSGGILWEQSVTGVVSDRFGAIYIYGGTGSGDLPYTARALKKENDYFSGWIAKFVAPAVPRIGTPIFVEFPPEACDQLRLSPQLIFNSGQAPLKIDSMVFASGDAYLIVNPPSFPLTLQPCDSISINLAFDPVTSSAPCNRNVRDTLRIYSSNAATSVATIPVVGRKSCVSFSIRDSDVDDPRYRLGSGVGYNLLAFARGDDPQFVTIEKLPGGSGDISLRTPWQNREVTEGVSSIDINVTSPDTGRVCASFLVTIQPCDRVDTINICAYVRSGFFNIAPDSINLGVVGCTEQTIPTKIWNTGNDTLDFKQIFVGGEQPDDIRYDIPWDSIRQLAPGDTFYFSTIYHPTGIGMRRAIPVFSTNEILHPTGSHVILSELDTVLFRLTAANLEGAYDDMLDLPIGYESLREGRAPITEITFLARFDPNLLEIVDVDRGGTMTEGWDVAESRLTNEGRIIRLVMGSGGRPLTGDGILARLKLQVLRGDTIASRLGFALEGISKGCLMALADSTFAFQLSDECLAHERLVFTGNRMLKPAYPNPAHSVLRIPFRVPVDGQVTITLYDMAGKVAAVLVHRKMPEGNDEIAIDTRLIPPGRYFCRMVVGELLSDTREVVIER